MRNRDSADGSLIRARKLDLATIERLSRRPTLWETEERSFWTDAYVSKHVLEAHLDPHIDDASRKPWQIAATVDRILEEAGHPERRAFGDPGSNDAFRPSADTLSPPRLLDVACGPGLYTEQFAARGFDVVGIDYSEISLQHAKRQAQKEGLAIEYRNDDFLSCGFGTGFDIITLIYGEFCTITDGERHSLLERVYRSLAPGGIFAFDAFTIHYVRRLRRGSDWYVNERNGFWQRSPHLVLERNFHFPEASASAARYIVVDAKGRYRTFTVWWRHFHREELVDLLESVGFEVNSVYGSLWGDAVADDDEWIGVFARKPLT
ncbi:MAG: class I SAM-dependent methyltransferase [Spirochaetota bacterium]